MKRWINIVLIILLSLCLSYVSHAQMNSGIAVGLRGTPDGGGITGKFYMHNNWAFEAQLNGSAGNGYADNDGASMVAVGLLEYNFILPDPSWRIFVGPGIHAGTWDRYNDGYEGRYRNVEAAIGIDGIAGVEYIFKEFPIGLSADIKPAVNFASEAAIFPNNFFGVSARYYLPTTRGHQHQQMHRPYQHS